MFLGMNQERDERADEGFETLGEAAARLLAGLDAKASKKRKNVIRICPFGNDEFGQPTGYDEWE